METYYGQLDVNQRCRCHSATPEPSKECEVTAKTTGVVLGDIRMNKKSKKSKNKDLPHHEQFYPE